MNRHGYAKRIGQPGQDLWQCQQCGDKGAFRQLMARECGHQTTQAEAEHNLLDAIGAFGGENPTYTVASIIPLQCNPPQTQVIFKIDDKDTQGIAPHRYSVCLESNPYKVGDKKTLSELLIAHEKEFIS